MFTKELFFLLPLLFALLIAPAVIFLLSRVSGWRTLADRYPCHEPMPVPRKLFGYGVFRKWIGYNGAFMVAGNYRGLYLFPLPVLLSFCHKPILIPWSEITMIRVRKVWKSEAFEIHTRRAPELDFALQKGTFEFIRESAVR